MASIQGVKVTGVIVPSSTLDTYAVIDPIYGIDGLRNLSGGTSELSGITSDRRRAGMLVGVNNGTSYYKLNPAPWTNTMSDWTPFSLGSTFTGGTVSGATTFTGGLSANTFSATTYQNLPKLQNVITVAKSGGDFTSIKTAVDSITTSSEINRYVVRVGPGVYQENEINLTTKPYVSIVGFDIQATVVVPATNTQNIFSMGNNTELSFMTLSGTGVGYAAISNIDLNGFALAHKLSMYDNDTNVLVQSNTSSTTFYGEYIDFNGNYSFGTKVVANNSFQAYANMENYYNYPSSSVKCIANRVQGSGATLNVFVGDGIGNGVESSTNYEIYDYASLNTTTTTAEGWGYCLRNPNIGGPVRFDIDSLSVVNSINYDVSIEQVGSFGTFNGSSTHKKVRSVSPNVFWSFLDSQDGEFEITRKMSVTFQDGTHTDMSTLIFEGGTMGLISGGTITSGIGFNANVGAGYGYLEKVTGNEIYQRLDWVATGITLPSNSNSYLYFNESGILSGLASRPDTTNNIVLGRVVTNLTGIAFIDSSPLNADHTSNRFATLFREAIGPIYAFGSIVTENITPFKINVSAGDYYFSTNEYTPIGGTGLTFTQYYNNGSGGWNTSATTFVNKTQFDNNGVLSGLTASAFTKHTLYIVGSGINEKYMVVLGQNQYNTLVECENALLPTPPTFFNDSVSEIANIYIRQGNSNILQFEDIRPVIGFKAGGVNASSLHANLLGLSSDDHKQYLLGDGSRAMAGTLNMGNNPIISAGTINNVTIESHAARHKHGGADEIATVTPSGSAIPKADANGKLDNWISNASSDVIGTTKLSQAPAVASNPIAVGVNDPRFLKSITGITSVGNTIAFKDVSGGTTVINDVRVTGGTYDSGSGTATFKNSTGGTFNVAGYFKPSDDIYVNSGEINHDLNVINLTRTDTSVVEINDIVTVIEKDRTEIINLMNNQLLVKGVTYKINNCDSSLYLNGYDKSNKEFYTTIYLKAIENNTLADTGVGVFYTPQYQNGNHWQIWSNLSNFSVDVINGKFNLDESVTGDQGSTGRLFGDINSGYLIVTGGDWASDTIVYGDLSGAHANITSVTIKNYFTDQIIFWGGTAWYCNDSFHTGAATDIFTLDTVSYPIKQILPLDENGKMAEFYNISYDEIKYDINADKITYRKDSNLNIVSTSADNIGLWVKDYGFGNPIKAFQWGNPLVNKDNIGIGNQSIVESYNENINFRGKFQKDIQMVNLSYQKDMFFESGSYQRDIYLDNSYQINVKLCNESSQFGINFKNSRQDTIVLANNSTQAYIKLDNGCGQNQVRLFHSTQNNISLLNKSSQSAIDFEDSYQSEITIDNNSYQSNITAYGGTEQRGIKIYNTSYQDTLYLGGTSQKNIILGNDSYQNDITFIGSFQTDVIFENYGIQRRAVIVQNGQTKTKFYNFEFDRGGNNITETDRIYTNTLRTENTAPQVIGIINNELVEVDVNTFGGGGVGTNPGLAIWESPGAFAINDSVFEFYQTPISSYGSTLLTFDGIYWTNNSSTTLSFNVSANIGWIGDGTSEVIKSLSLVHSSLGVIDSDSITSNIYVDIQTSSISTNITLHQNEQFAIRSNFYLNGNPYANNSSYNTLKVSVASLFNGEQGPTGPPGSSSIELINTTSLASVGLNGGLATVAGNSNFFGVTAGAYATNAFQSNFFGNSAGAYATNANDSNFFGYEAGYQASNAAYSNFLGNYAGNAATEANFSNFLGTGAGNQATGASQSNFLGVAAGYSATSANNSNFLGFNAGYQATGASQSNFFGQSAGFYALNASQSNFFGTAAGQNATGATNSNFIGYQAGLNAINATNSNFFGQQAGYSATGATGSNFFGQAAGYSATNANNSNFFGQAAGYSATGATNSNFIGNNAGNNAKNTQFSNFMGWQAGFYATNASNSNFFGYQAGYSATTATYSNLFGYQAGKSFIGNNIGSNNIIIGTNISLPNAATNSINIGGVLFGTGTYSNIITNPSIVPVATGRIGIGVVTPTKRLHISGETANDSGLRLERLTSASPVSTGQAIGVDSNGNVVTVSGGGGGATIIYTAVTTSSILTNVNQTVIVNSSADITITLPQITGDGILITIKNINTGIETILPYSGQLIDGDTSVIVARKNVSLDLQSYNNNWYVI